MGVAVGVAVAWLLGWAWHCLSCRQLRCRQLRCGNPQLQSGRCSALLCASVSVRPWLQFLCGLPCHRTRPISTRGLLFCSFALLLFCSLLAAQAKILALAVFLQCPPASCAIIGTSVYGFAIVKLFPLIIHYSFLNNPSILINFLYKKFIKRPLCFSMQHVNFAIRLNRKYSE